MNSAATPKTGDAPRKRWLQRMAPLLRRLVLPFGRTLGHTLIDLTVEGQENLPQQAEPLLVVANHFGWFDAPLLTLFLPFQPVFLVATESQRKWYVRTFLELFNGVPIWRGQVDRNAFRSALRVLDSGQSLGIFPEGGINPDLAERIARGETIPQLAGNTSRRSGALTHGKPGAALLAVMSQVRLLPVALIGTERIGDNLRRMQRARVTIRIGKMFGPLSVDSTLSGHERRLRLDHLTDQIMLRVATMFPVEQQGPYQQMVRDNA